MVSVIDEEIWFEIDSTCGNPEAFESNVVRMTDNVVILPWPRNNVVKLKTNVVKISEYVVKMASNVVINSFLS